MASRSRVIRTTPARAFDYLSDLSRHHEWAINALRVEPLDGPPFGEGSRFRSTGTQFGQTLRDEVVITAWEPGRRLEYQAVGRGGTFRHALLFEEVPGGTRVTKVMEPRRLTFPLSLFAPVTGLVLGRRMARDLERIAARLETAGGAGGPA